MNKKRFPVMASESLGSRTVGTPREEPTKADDPIAKSASTSVIRKFSSSAPRKVFMKTTSTEG